MKNKIIWTIFFVLFSIYGAIFMSDEYISNIKNIKSETKNHLYIQEEVEKFDINDLKTIEKTDIFYTPYKNLLDEIVDSINEAKETVYISSYIFTEKRIKNASINAHKRWLDVKIIMEKNPYMAYNINNSFYDEFQKKWIQTVWSNTNNYWLNHAKFLLIDNLSIISTWNISYSTFTKNRDFFVITKDESINKKLYELFLIDFEWKKEDIYHPNLVLSPNYSRTKIFELINNSKKEIKIYIQYFNDISIVNELIKIKKEKDINITAIIAETSINDKNTKKLIDSWIKIKALEKNKMHSKAILVDSDILFIGSVNFSKQSFDENRELWILLKDKNIISKFNNQFNKDLKD